MSNELGYNGVVIYKQIYKSGNLLSLHYNEPDLDFINDQKLYLITNPHNDTDNDMFWKTEQNIWNYCEEHHLDHFTLDCDRTNRVGLDLQKIVEEFA